MTEESEKCPNPTAIELAEIAGGLHRPRYSDGPPLDLPGEIL